MQQSPPVSGFSQGFITHSSPRGSRTRRVPTPPSRRRTAGQQPPCSKGRLCGRGGCTKPKYLVGDYSLFGHHHGPIGAGNTEGSHPLIGREQWIRWSTVAAQRFNSRLTASRRWSLWDLLVIPE